MDEPYYTKGKITCCGKCGEQRGTLYRSSSRYFDARENLLTRFNESKLDLEISALVPFLRYSNFEQAYFKRPERRMNKRLCPGRLSYPDQFIALRDHRTTVCYDVIFDKEAGDTNAPGRLT